MIHDAYELRIASSRDDMADAARLFAEYVSALPIDLDYQDFEAEVAGLPGKYATPAGAILIARDRASSAVGCVGIRPLSSHDVCEMKRLFTVTAVRGTGLGKALAEAAIRQARAMGYCEMRLDTLPTMKTAVALYRQLGFREIAAYYHPTPSGTIFMALDLQAGSSQQ